MTHDEIEQRLVDYITASTCARPILSQLHGLEIEATEIQSALCSILTVDDPIDLLEKNLTQECIIKLLRNFDFQLYHPEVLAQFELDDGIIPHEVVRLLSEQTVKVKGEVWRVHKNDADPWPSNPHAHNYESSLKLHLGTGELFDRNRRLVGIIGRKKLEAIRNKLDKITLPEMTT